jgi:hypothetical protein
VRAPARQRLQQSPQPQPPRDNRSAAARPRAAPLDDRSAAAWKPVPALSARFLGAAGGSPSDGFAVVDGAFAHWPIARPPLGRLPTAAGETMATNATGAGAEDDEGRAARLEVISDGRDRPGARCPPPFCTAHPARSGMCGPSATISFLKPPERFSPSRSLTLQPSCLAPSE